MSYLQFCDLCHGHPLDYDGKSGGDVRRVRLEVDGEVKAPVESRSFDACAHCRVRIFGEVLEKIAPDPQTATGIPRNEPVNMKAMMR